MVDGGELLSSLDETALLSPGASSEVPSLTFRRFLLVSVRKASRRQPAIGSDTPRLSWPSTTFLDFATCGAAPLRHLKNGGMQGDAQLCGHGVMTLRCGSVSAHHIRGNSLGNDEGYH